METNDKLPKENDYSLAYSSYNTLSSILEEETTTAAAPDAGLLVGPLKLSKLLCYEEKL